MGGAVFSGVINGRATAWMMIGMLVFAVAWEAFTNYLERRFEENKAHSEILSKVYKELMILGFIAFALIMGKEVGLIAWSNETLHCFEFCDLLVSICVLVYVGNCAISSFTMHTAQREWDRIALTMTAEVIEDVESHLEKVRQSSFEQLKAKLPFSADWRSDADFKVLQLLFQTKFHLPLTFDYVMYIKLVLEGVVVTMANISTWHWLIIMAINFVWWLGMVYLLPLLAQDAAPISNKICMFGCDEVHRRQLGGAAAEPEVCQATLPGDVCDMNGTELHRACEVLQSHVSETSYWNQCSECLQSKDADGLEDITSDQTLSYLLLYTFIGWVVVSSQFTIVAHLRQRMHKILELYEATEAENVTSLLQQLQQTVVEHHQKQLQSASSSDQLSLENNDDERTDLLTHQDLHHAHLVNMDAEAHDREADHIMVFDKGNQTSNDILSIRHYEALMFMTQLNQLVIDFYFGFYFVHMAQRVPKAFGREGLFDGDTQLQLLFHVAILSSVAVVLYLLMVTTRKISLLIGVLHLSEDAMSEVLTHMDMVKSLRNRIKETLRKTSLVRGEKNPKEAQSMMDRAIEGEIALLKQLGPDVPLLVADREPTSRIDRREINQLMVKYKEHLNVTQAQLDTFLSRDEYKAFQLMTKHQQTRAQTAKTVLIGADGLEDDSVEIGDLCSFFVRSLCVTLLECMQLSPTLGAMRKFTQSLQCVDAVTDEMFQQGLDVARARALFDMADSDGSGDISRSELYSMIKQFKVPITKKDFRTIFRVIDPDQSHSIEMSEWLDFMLATDQDLEQAAMDANKKQQQSNADKGTKFSTLVGEGAGIFLGEKVGKALGDGVGMAGKITDATLSSVSGNETGATEKMKQETDLTDVEVAGGAAEQAMANPLAKQPEAETGDANET